MATFIDLIPRLREAGVEFVIVGGVAAAYHGSVRSTSDLDVVASMALDNLQKLIVALADLHPRFRMRPDLPVVTPDNPNLRGMKNLYLKTDFGQLDVLGELEGIGPFGEVAKRATEVDMGDDLGRCKVLDLDTLIDVKRAVGRPKDIMAVHELELARKRLRGESIVPKTPDSGPPPDPRA